MKQAADSKTLEIPGIPEIKRRGRPPKGDKAMTAAERQRASRASRFKTAVKTGGKGRVPVQLSCVVDEATRRALNKLAHNNACSVGEVIDLLVAQTIAPHD